MLNITAVAAAEPLDLVAEMAGDFAASHDVHATLAHGLQRIADWVGAEAASLFLVDDTAGGLVCSVCLGPVDVTGLSVPMGDGIVGRTVAEDRARMVRDAATDADFRDSVDRRTGFTTRSVLCAPMSVAGTRLGAIELINKRGGGLFNAADQGLLQALAASAALALLNARMAAAMVEQERVRRELELAAHIQRGMLPEPQGPAAAAAGVNRAARSVSGDFFDLVELPGDRLAFCIGDVSGKGIDAALLMVKTASLFRCLAKEGGRPGALLARINAELCETGGGGRFVTMIAGLLDRASGRAVLANAGHEPALLCRGADFQEYGAVVPPLGIGTGLVPPDMPESEVALDGARLYLFTDGLTEAPAGAGMLGAEGVRRLIAETARLDPAAQAAAMVERAAGRGILHDDSTLLVIEGRR